MRNQARFDFEYKDILSIEGFCGEPKVSEAKIAGFENRIAEYKRSI